MKAEFLFFVSSATTFIHIAFTFSQKNLFRQTTLFRVTIIIPFIVKSSFRHDTKQRTEKLTDWRNRIGENFLGAIIIWSYARILTAVWACKRASELQTERVPPTRHESDVIHPLPLSHTHSLTQSPLFLHLLLLKPSL